MTTEGLDTMWGAVRLWKKLFYVLGATLLGVTLAGIPAALSFALGAPDWLSMVVLAVAALFSVPLVYRWMREDYEYVHSAAYATRNPDFAPKDLQST